MSEKRIACPPDMNEDTGRTLLASIQSQELTRGDTLVFDLSHTSNMDSLGGAWLIEIAGRVATKQVNVRCEGHQGRVAEFVELIEPALTPKPKQVRGQLAFFEGIGESVLNVWGELREFFRLLVDTIYWLFIAPLEGRGFRWELFMDEMHEMGVRAIRINCLMNFLLGLIISMLSAAQVRPFGVELWVADLIMIGFARELAAIMTAIVVSARTGAAITAELATMKVQEEIDALRGMGLNVVQFLVVPKVLALVIVMPLLSTLGLLSGVLGGTLWGVTVLGIRPDVWLDETIAATHGWDLFQGFLKTLSFAVAIVLIGCHNGLRVSGGSRGVGLMTTRAVVMDTFFVITIDIVFALVFYYMLE